MIIGLGGLKLNDIFLASEQTLVVLVERFLFLLSQLV
jgi:hypothetical protein